MNGYNGTIFAYGMSNPLHEPNNKKYEYASHTLTHTQVRLRQAGLSRCLEQISVTRAWEESCRGLAGKHTQHTYTKPTTHTLHVHMHPHRDIFELINNDTEGTEFTMLVCIVFVMCIVTKRV